MSTRDMNRLWVAVAAFLVAAPLLARASQRANLALEIQKVAETKFGYTVSIRVKNVGPDVVLMGTGDAPKLQSLDVQQWDDKLGWQSVGPCRDVPATTVLTIAPQQQLEDVVPIGDLEHGWSSSVCPRVSKELVANISKSVCKAHSVAIAPPSLRILRLRLPRHRSDLHLSLLRASRQVRPAK